MATAKELFETKIQAMMAEKGSMAPEINAVYQFDLAGDGGGKYFINLRNGEGPSAGEGEVENPECVISMAADDFAGMLEGTKNAQMLFMSGKLKVKGQMGLALKLQRVLG